METLFSSTPFIEEVWKTLCIFSSEVNFKCLCETLAYLLNNNFASNAIWQPNREHCVYLVIIPLSGIFAWHDSFVFKFYLYCISLFPCFLQPLSFDNLVNGRMTILQNQTKIKTTKQTDNNNKTHISAGKLNGLKGFKVMEQSRKTIIWKCRTREYWSTENSKITFKTVTFV